MINQGDNLCSQFTTLANQSNNIDWFRIPDFFLQTVKIVNNSFPFFHPYPQICLTKEHQQHWYKLSNFRVNFSDNFTHKNN